MPDEPAHSLRAPVESDSAVPYCSSDVLDVSLRWRAADDGSLRGHVTVRNTGTTACRVGGKPRVTPLGLDGAPLRAETVITMEERFPRWIALQPGDRAAARVGWGGWCGEPGSGRARVRWEHGEATVSVDGPAQPRCPDGGQPLNLWSSWFTADGGSDDDSADTVPRSE